MNESKFKEIIQSCHLNFLIGSGCSVPYLSALGRVEYILTELDKKEGVSEEAKKIAKVSILKNYFEACIYKNKNITNDALDSIGKSVLEKYKFFLQTINEIVIHRKTNLINKQINLFTTNMDVFLEHSLEELNLEFNDGFVGRLKPSFDLSNFKKSVFKTSAHYDNISELPLFNIYKMHGSVTWKMIDDKKVLLDTTLKTIDSIHKVTFERSSLVNLFTEDGNLKEVDEILDEATLISFDKEHDRFLSLYDDLIIVNPTKEKFKFTTLNYTYYELLRMFSNELEKENSVLFVMGFSFSDEHIREIVLRALNSNPTLIVSVFAYDSIAEGLISNNLKLKGINTKYNNLVFMPRHTRSNENGEEDNEIEFDLTSITQLYFGALAKRLTNKEQVTA